MSTAAAGRKKDLGEKFDLLYTVLSEDECYDYTEGAHPKVLESSARRRIWSPSPATGRTAACEAAKEKIRAACGREDLQIAFLAGGTQTNLVVISAHAAALRGRSSPRPGISPSTRPGPSSTPATRCIALRARRQARRRDACGLSGRVLRQRGQRAHGPPGHGLHLPPHRVRHALHEGGADGPVRHSAGSYGSRSSSTGRAWATA